MNGKSEGALADLCEHDTPQQSTHVERPTSAARVPLRRCIGACMQANKHTSMRVCLRDQRLGGFAQKGKHIHCARACDLKQCVSTKNNTSFVSLERGSNKMANSVSKNIFFQICLLQVEKVQSLVEARGARGPQETPK